MITTVDGKQVDGAPSSWKDYEPVEQVMDKSCRMG